MDTGTQYVNKILSDFGDEIWTIESKAYTAAEHLIQEINNCDKTALSLFQSLDVEFKGDDRIVFSETSAHKYLTDIFLKKYEVVDMRIFKKNRRIEFCWNKGNTRWVSVMGDSLYKYHSSPNMFIVRDENLLNKVEYDIVVSRYGMFFVSNHPLRGLLLNLSEKNDPNETQVLEIIIGYIHSLNRDRKNSQIKVLKHTFNLMIIICVMVYGNILIMKIWCPHLEKN